MLNFLAFVLRYENNGGDTNRKEHNMKISKFAAAGLLIAGLAAGAPVLAQDSGFYIGTGVGYVDFGSSDAPFVAGATVAAFSSDNSSTGFKVFGGYQFNRTWGVEASYIDFGSPNFNGVVSVGGATGSFGGSADLTAWTLALTGTMPLSQQWDLTGKVGVYNWSADNAGAIASVPGVGTFAVAAGDDSGTDAMAGIGIRYNINKNFGVHADWEYFNSSNNSVNMFSIGLRYKF